MKKLTSFKRVIGYRLSVIGGLLTINCLLITAPQALAQSPNVFVTNSPTKPANVILRDASGNYVDASGGGGGGGGASTIADGADVTQGAKADAKSTATDTTAVSMMSVLKQISASAQAPPSQAVTNAGTFAVQNTTAAGENHIGEVGGRTAVVTDTFTRPSDTTAYASGDLVANSTTAGSVTPLAFTTVTRIAAGSGMIRRCRIKTSSTSITTASFRVHLYKASPTPSNGDNAAWLTDQAANYLGAFDVTLDKAFTDGATGNGVPNVGSEINFKLASGSTIYGLIEARSAYTPTSAGTFLLELEILQN